MLMEYGSFVSGIETMLVYVHGLGVGKFQAKFGVKQKPKRCVCM